ncbi:Beta-galactosidase, partial [Tetrabaena socialis]
PVRLIVEQAGGGSGGSCGAVTVHAAWVLRPAAREGGAGAGVEEGVGIGETGGAHWFALAGAAHDGTVDAPAGTAGGPSAAPPASTNTPPGPTDPPHTPSPEGEIAIRATYAIHPGGTIRIDWHMDTTRALPAPLAPGLSPSLPRVGVRGAAPGRLGGVAWQGRGPHECYSDRRAGAAVGQYGGDVRRMRVPYVFPQESGGRVGVRWLALLPKPPPPPAPSHPTATAATTSTAAATATATVAGGPGLAVLAAAPMCAASSAPALQFSVSEHSLEAVHAARHEHEIAPDPAGRSFFHLDHAHMGVGGDDSWSPTVHPEFMVAPAVHEWSIVLAPCHSAAEAEWAYTGFGRC